MTKNHRKKAVYQSVFGVSESLLKLIFPGFLSGLSLIAPLTSLIFISEIKASPSQALSKQSFVAEAVAKSGSAVVTLETQRTIRSQGLEGIPPGLLLDPNFQGFFKRRGIRFQRSRIERSQGSGVIFSSEGLVLTNAHVIEQIDKVTVGLSDGRRVVGRVIGQDSLTDLAVIRLNGIGPWPIAPLGNSDELRVGDWAIAVGNPYGLENTVTLGIISNINRNVSQLGISGKRLELIQTDAAINPGNSGGPLLNANGEVIGINTLVRSGPGAGLGFAIPINRAMSIANQIAKKGKASHPMVGIGLSKVQTPGQVGSNKPGAIIRYLMPNGPADIAGLKINDLILKINGIRMQDPAQIVSTINQNGLGKTLKFEIKRGRERLEVNVLPVEISKINNN